MVDTVAQPKILSAESNLVTSGPMIFLLVGVTHLGLSGLVRVAQTPLLRVPLIALHHDCGVPGPLSGPPA